MERDLQKEMRYPWSQQSIMLVRRVNHPIPHTHHLTGVGGESGDGRTGDERRPSAIWVQNKFDGGSADTYDLSTREKPALDNTDEDDNDSQTPSTSAQASIEAYKASTAAWIDEIWLLTRLSRTRLFFVPACSSYTPVSHRKWPSSMMKLPASGH
jgi:hypothetical protein